MLSSAGEFESLLYQFPKPRAIRRLKGLHYDVMVPPAGADLGDPVNFRKFLPVIQSDIEIERSVAGFLICPHPEEFPIDRVAELRTKLFFTLPRPITYASIA